MVSYLLKSTNPEYAELWERFKLYQREKRIPSNALIFLAIEGLLSSDTPSPSCPEYLSFKEETEKRLNALENNLISRTLPSLMQAPKKGTGGHTTKEKGVSKGFIFNGSLSIKDAVIKIKEHLRKENTTLKELCNRLQIVYNDKGLSTYPGYRLEALYNHAIKHN